MLEDWIRQYYRPGGGDALLFYVVFGQIGHSVQLTSAKYRCSGLPEGLELMKYGGDTHPAVVDSFREGYVWETLRKEEPDFAQRIAEQRECVVFRGNFPDTVHLNHFRDIIGLITHMLDNGGVAVYDPQILHWWTPESWRERIFDPAGPVPRHHVVILASPEEQDGRMWLHTRGMRKYGRPDISIPHVPPSYFQAAIDLCNRFIDIQAFGEVIPEGQDIRMKALPEGLTCHHGGDLEDPDFNNTHVEVRGFGGVSIS